MSQITWLSFDEALEKSYATEVPVLVYFFKPNSTECTNFEKKTFTDAEVIEYLTEAFACVKADGTSKQKLSFDEEDMTFADLAKTFEVDTYPTVALMWEDEVYVPDFDINDPQDFLGALDEYFAEMFEETEEEE